MVVAVKDELPLGELNAQPGDYDRVAIVGKTGSGKTFAGKLLTLDIPRLVCIDSKRISLSGWNLDYYDPMARIRLKGGNRAIRLRKAMETDSEQFRIRVVPGVGYDYDGLFKYLFGLHNITIYIDELYRVLPAKGQSGQYLDALYTQGREMHIGVYACMQRPSWVPLFALSESEWIYQFRLQLPTDKKRMAEIIGPAATTDLKGHEVLVYNQEWDDPIHFASIAEGE